MIISAATPHPRTPPPPRPATPSTSAITTFATISSSPLHITGFFSPASLTLTSFHLGLYRLLGPPLPLLLRLPPLREFQYSLVSIPQASPHQLPNLHLLSSRTPPSPQPATPPTSTISSPQEFHPLRTATPGRLLFSFIELTAYQV